MELAGQLVITSTLHFQQNFHILFQKNSSLIIQQICQKTLTRISGKNLSIFFKTLWPACSG